MKLLAVLFPVLLFPQTLFAFITDSELDPNPAAAGQTVNLHLQTGICDGIVGGENNPAITIDGSTIDVLIDGIRESDPTWCNLPVVDHNIPIGSFEAGEYTVTVRFRYTPFGLPTETEILGEISLTVQRKIAPRSVSGLGFKGIGLSAILLFLMGLLACERRSF